MMHAEIYRMNLSAEKLRALSPHERYVFALTGHVFNELMLLQKLAHVSRRPPDVEGPVADASVGVAMFMIRVLVGKTYEALSTLRKKSIADVLNDHYFGLIGGISEQWAGSIALAESLDWLKTIRDQGAFHYPNANQLSSHLDDAYCEGAYVLVGKRYGDTFFHWGEMAASLPAMRRVNAEDPLQGLAQMLDQIGDLLGRMTECLAIGLQAYMKAALANDDEGLSDPVQFSAPDFEAFHLPYFFSDPRLQD